MKERTLRDAVAIGVVTSHLWITLLCFILFVANGMLFDQLIKVLAVVVPLVAVYTTAVVSYYTESRYLQPVGKTVNHVYVFLAIVFPVAYVISLSVLIVLFAFHLGPTFDQLIESLGILETVLGVYAAKLIQSMFTTPAT